MADSERRHSLRRRAEARVLPPREVGTLSPGEVRALVHELDVHQAELELQNEELRNLTLALEAARDRFRDLFDFAPAGYLILERDGAILEANLKAGELFGCERAKLLNQRVQNFIAPDSQDRFHLHQQAVLESGRPRSCELVVLTEDGRSRDVTLEGVPIGDTHRRIRVSLVDISARVRAESTVREAKEELERTVAARTVELEQSRRLNEKILEAAPLLLWIFDLETQSIVYANAFVRDLLGYRSAEELATLALEDLVDPSDVGPLRTAMDQLERGSSWDVTEVAFRMRTAQGSVRWVSSRLAVFERDRNGHLSRILGASTDVTELHRAEARMRQLRHEASIASERERRELAAMLHDSIGQLLPLANTKLALARRSCDEATEAKLVEVERLIRETHTAATSLTFRLNPPALQEIGLLAGLRALAREMRRDYDLRVVLEDEAPGSVLSDALAFAIYRVVHELLVNVAKHSGAKQANVSLARVGSRLSVVVEDRGLGFVASANRTRGRGLNSAEERLAYLGGRMVVRSAPDRGTRVELYAPLLEREPAELDGRR
jgi:PAS domain S-box-containing protein